MGFRRHTLSEDRAEGFMKIPNILKSWFENVHYFFTKLFWVLLKHEIDFKKMSQKNIKQLAKTKKEIFEIIETNNPYQLMSSLSLARNFLRKDYIETVGFDQPHLHLLAGLCLKIGRKNKNPVQPKTILKIQSLLKDYSTHYSTKLMVESILGRDKDKKADVKFTVKQQKIIEQINPNAYEFQILDYLTYVFNPMNDLLVNEFGFTVQDALIFKEEVLKLYIKRVDQRINAARKLMEEEKAQGNFDVVKNEKKRELTVAAYWMYLLSKDSDFLFIFSEEDLKKENHVLDSKKVLMYLNCLSSELGKVNQNYNDLLDENEIILKPFICEDEKYFCPIPQELLANLPKIFENLIKQLKVKKPESFEKLKELKSEYLENRSAEYFSRVFSKENVFRNLIYQHNGQKYEIDTLVLYDTNVLIVECKSGEFTEFSKKVKPRVVERDLNNLIGDAYEQTSRVREYLKSDKNPVLEFADGTKFLRLNQNVQFNYYLINVTLASLMNLASNPSDLKHFDLIPGDETLWSVNIFELDLITTYLAVPSIFLHFLKKRLEQHSKNIFRAFDETSFFSYYLKTGGFVVPENDDGKPFDFVALDSDWTASFDAHYLNGDPAPRLEIDQEFLELILEIQKLDAIGFSEVIFWLLELNSQTRIEVIKRINNIVAQTRNDHKEHDMSFLFSKNPTGFTFIARWGVANKKLESFCYYKKYVTKAERWIGFENDCLEGKKYFTKYFFIEAPWVLDDEFEKTFN
jgi:hypothetical protein